MTIAALFDELANNWKETCMYNTDEQPNAKKPHKHAEVIKAWADGAKVQTRCSGGSTWATLCSPQWHENQEYRVAPEPHAMVKAGILQGDLVWYEQWREGLTLARVDHPSAADRVRVTHLSGQHKGVTSVVSVPKLIKYADLPAVL